jgi:hypothetical protein
MGEYGWLGRASGVQLGGIYKYEECVCLTITFRSTYNFLVSHFRTSSEIIGRRP